MAYNVLIVDDSVIIRNMVAKTLQMTGVELGQMHYASNGETALQILEDNWIDIVFADINMPVMDGEEMIRRMNDRDILSTVPVVVISTEQSRDKIGKLRELGISDYLTKPFMPEQFKEVVQKHLERD